MTLYDFLTPLIGKAGMWFLWILLTAISFILILDEIPDLKHIIKKFNAYRKVIVQQSDKLWQAIRVKIENPFFDKKSTERMTTIVSKRKVKNIKSVRQKTPKKIVHKKRVPKKKKEQEDTLPMLEDRSLDDIGNIEIQKIGQSSSSQKNPTKEKILETEIPPVKEKALVKEEKTQPEKETSSKILDELKANKELMAQLEKGKIEEPEDFILPYLDFLEEAPRSKTKVDEEEIDRKVHELLDKLGQFKITGEVMDIYSGPLVTTFEFKPAANVKVSKILNLQDDLAMALRAQTIRIQAPIPGRNVVGIEIPNEEFNTIYLRDILESELFQTSKSPLTMAMGKDIVGNPFVTDLKKLPHLLIAGTTGSGKSVGINAMILSLLYRNDPDSLKLMLIDPKMLEFSIYNDIPHLITPVITDATKAIAALSNMVGEMERRYKLMAESRTKNIDNYNEKAKKRGLDTLPFIVVVIDELADLMMTGGKDVEYSIARLAQMARASGIHLIIATQRPSVDVVTGLIKANLPSRLSYRVGQRIDSKVILDALGADTLLGKGDALFTPPYDVYWYGLN
jgi:S-DNA-T family DNA segregation ATPase FtsK/SpoIIIE